MSDEIKKVTVTILESDAVSNGENGHYAKGDKVELPEDVADALKARKLAK